MRVEAIEAMQERALAKFDVAKQIRELLDAARKECGEKEWDDDDMESEILALVTEE